MRLWIIAGVAVVGLLVGLVGLAPAATLGVLGWLVLTIAAIALAGWRAWRSKPDGWHASDRVAIELEAARRRSGPRQEHARTVGAVASGLIGPGLTRGDGGAGGPTPT